MFGSLALLVAAGALAATLGGWWGQFWIWAALVLLVVISAVAVAFGSPHYRRLYAAVAAATAKESSAAQGATGSVEDAELRMLLVSPRPLVVSAVAAMGLVAILWLMLFKPA
jgi:hypothetical protein